MKSLISSHFKSSSRSIVKAGHEKDSTVFAGAEDENLTEIEIESQDGFTESPEEIMISKEYWEAIERAFAEFKDEYAIYSEWLDGTSPRIIAEAFEIPVNEVNNAIKRGTRIVKTLFKNKS